VENPGFGTLICGGLQIFFWQFSAAFEKQGRLKIAYQTQLLAGVLSRNGSSLPGPDSRPARGSSTHDHLHRSKARL
jgi:hypothetical protein